MHCAAPSKISGLGAHIRCAFPICLAACLDSLRCSFRWCQQLGGVDFVPPLPLATMLHGPEVEAAVAGLDTYRRDQRAVGLVQRLVALKEATAAPS